MSAALQKGCCLTAVTQKSAGGGGGWGGSNQTGVRAAQLEMCHVCSSAESSGLCV